MFSGKFEKSKDLQEQKELRRLLVLNSFNCACVSLFASLTELTEEEKQKQFIIQQTRLNIVIQNDIKKEKMNQQKIINMTENLSIRYHANLNDKYMSKSAHILHYLIHHRFDRENSCWFQRQNLKYKNSC